LNDLLSKSEDTVKFGESLGADEIEVYMMSHTSKRVILTGKTWTFFSSYNTGLGVRVVIDKKTGFLATSSIGIKDIQMGVKKAYKMAKIGKQDGEWISLPTKTGKINVEQAFDKEIQEVTPSRLSEEAKQMVNAVDEFGDCNSITRGEISTDIVETAISNNHNCSLLRKGTFASTNISVKAEKNGKKGVSSESQQTRSLRKLNCYSLAKIAAKRANKIIYAEPIPSGKLPIIWSNKEFASVLRTMFGRTLCADHVQKERSPWIGKMGKQIASENFNLVDDGLLTGGIKTREFDDEGIPQRRLTLVEQGVLQAFLYDNYTAKKDKRESTGNSYRNYDRLPTPAPNNLMLQPGKIKERALFEEVKMGLYLIETIGTWLSNPISGDLSATATNAFLIENGVLTKPVKGVIVSGNFFEILQHGIELIADDVKNRGSAYSPSVKISEMSVTG